MSNVCDVVLEWGFSSPEHTNIRCYVKELGALGYGARQAVAQSEFIAKLRIGLWKHRGRCFGDVS